MSFDLENLDKEIKDDGTSAPAEVSAGATLDDIYDRFQKFVFTFDISGSMAEGMMPGEIEQVAIWTPEIVERLRAAIIELGKQRVNGSPYRRDEAKMNLMGRVAQLQQEATEAKETIDELKETLKEGGLDADERDEIKEEIEALKETIEDLDSNQIPAAMNPSADDIEREAAKLAIGFDPANTELLKLNTYLRGLDRTVGVEVVRTGLGLTSISKMEVVKTSAVGFINQRLDKYPSADIVVVEFDDRVKVVSKKASRSELIDRINSMQPCGGTDIYLAVKTAIEECKKRPANVGANHIVLVTDGDSHTVSSLPGLIPEMKEKGIVLDFIFIKSSGGWTATRLEASDYVAQITKVATETNGQVVTVDNAQSLSKKFFEVSSRKCLPPKPE